MQRDIRNQFRVSNIKAILLHFPNGPFAAICSPETFLFPKFRALNDTTFLYSPFSLAPGPISALNVDWAPFARENHIDLHFTVNPGRRRRKQTNLILRKS